MSKRKPKPEINISHLSDEQKAFIVKKCVQLGSRKAVRESYRMGDTVSEYAQRVARGLFGEEGGE